MQRYIKKSTPDNFFAIFSGNIWWNRRKYVPLHPQFRKEAQLIFIMVPVVQLVRASDCGSECRRFESVRAPQQIIPVSQNLQGFLFFHHLNF